MKNRNNKIFTLIIIVFLFNFFIVGCSKVNETQDTISQTASTDNLQTSSSGILNEKPIKSPEGKGLLKSSTSLESWVGDYTFSEFIPPDENMFYSVSIYRENNSYYAKINIDGYQTLKRLQAKVNGDTNSIKLIFDKYLPDNTYESYNVGDILITFEKTNAGIKTSWGKLTPIDDENKKSGIYFYPQETSEGYVGHWYTSLPETGGNSTTIEIKEISDTSVNFHLYFCRAYYYDGKNIKLKNNIAKFTDNDGDYETSGTIEFDNKSIVVTIEKTTMPMLKPGKTIFYCKVKEFNPISVTPHNGATDVTLDKGIEIDFGRKIFYTTNGIGAVLTKVNVTPGTDDDYIILDGEIKGNKLILTPSPEFSKIEAGQRYELGIDECSLRDEKGNINSDISLEFTLK